MENRISIVSIILEDTTVSGEVNDLLHQYAPFVIGRLGIPYRERGLSIICVILEAPGDVTSALSGKLGMVRGVSVKTTTAKSGH